MHCKGCAATIEGSLRRRQGVLKASVDYAKGEGWVLYDPSKTSLDSLLSDPVFEEPSPFEAEVLQDQEA
jgi:copper chaperone CopZ